MQSFELQIVRSALAELTGDIQAHVQDPQAQGKVQMTRFLLAHLLGQQEAVTEYAGIDEEVASLQKAEQIEKRLLAPPVAGSGFGVAVTAEALTDYLRDKLKEPRVTITKLQASLGGFSKQTYLIELSGADRIGNRIVMRRDQTGGPVESLSADECPVLQLMHRRGVPVP